MAPQSERWHVYAEQGGSISISEDKTLRGFAFMTMIDVTNRWRKDQLARAHLMAAAPDLLEACKAVSQAPLLNNSDELLRQIKTKVRTAIKKAEGKEPQ